MLAFVHLVNNRVEYMSYLLYFLFLWRLCVWVWMFFTCLQWTMTGQDLPR